MMLLLIFLFASFPDFSFAQDNSERGTGLVRETPESLKNVKRAPDHHGNLPTSIDLSPLMPTPGDQGKQGSCTAWAVAYARAYYQAKAFKSSQGNKFKAEWNIPSPAYIYRSTLKFPNMCDFGSSVSDGLKLLKERGAGAWAAFPYNAQICNPLSIAEIQAGTDFRIYDFEYTSSKFTNQFLNNIKAELAEGNPVIVSMKTTEAFDRLKAGSIYSQPTICKRPGNDCGHAVVFVGYDDQKQAFKLLNSWGTGWADHGFGWISYAAANTELEVYYVIRMERGKPHILYFQNVDAQVDEGMHATFRWEVASADSLELVGIADLTKPKGVCYSSQACDDVVITEIKRNGESLSGWAKIKMRNTTTLTIKAENAKGSQTMTLNINVIPKPAPPPKPPRKPIPGEEKI